MACVQIYFYFVDSRRFLEGYLLLYFVMVDVLYYTYSKCASANAL